MGNVEKKMPKLIVSGIAYNNEKVMLIKRASKPFAGYWSTVGGKVEYGEELDGALRREFKEEMGVNLSNVEFFGFLDILTRGIFNQIVTPFWIL